MKKFIPLTLFGLLMLISAIPLYFFFRDSFCLSCLIGMILSILGLVLLINGILSFARGLKKDDSGVEGETDNLTIGSILEPVFWIKDATIRIIRNRRRSASMISGIILSSMIISSIFIFTGVMQEDIYEVYVKAIPYETSYKMRERGNESYLWNLAEEIDDDKRIESSTVITGNTPMSIFNRDENDWDRVSYSTILTIQEDIGSDGSDLFRDFRALPLFVRQNFSETSIYEKAVGEDLEGSFDLEPSRNRTIIPRTNANKLNLEVGDSIDVLNITIYEIFQGRENEGLTIQIRDVIVTGIYSDEQDEASEFFFFNTEILERNEPEFIDELEEKNLFILAVKVNPDEFDVSNMNRMGNQVNRLKNDITRLSDGQVKGQNYIEQIISSITFIRYFILFLDFIMILPTGILSIYFLIFGLDLSLEERKREVAILKVQGANPKQIFQMVSMESAILFVIGITIGYLLSIVAAWIISSSIGFMTFDFSFSYFKEFVDFHQTAFLSSTITVGLIVLISIYVKARKFIDMEVTEGVQRLKEKKKNIFRRYQLDLILFGIGIIAVTRTILRLVFDIDSIFGVELSLGDVWDFLLFSLFGTVAIWVGGSLSGPVISQWIALKTENLFLKLAFLKDVSLIIKSGLRRRGDTAKLVLIIVLTLSVATLASVQGYTDQRFSERNLEYEVGADFKVIFSTNADHTGPLVNITGINSAMPIPSETVDILSSARTIHGIDAKNASFMKWHHDSFNDMDHKNALKDLEKRSNENGIFIGSDLAEEMGYKRGDRFEMRIQRSFVLPGKPSYTNMEVLVLGVFDHIPSHISRSSILCDHSLILKIRALKGHVPDLGDIEIPDFDINDFENFSEYGYLINALLQSYSPDLNSTVYLLDASGNADPSIIRKELDKIDEVVVYYDLKKEKNKISDQMNFGIPGLLTMMFIASIIAVFTSAFAFSSIIIKRRMREFAVLQTVGASRWQIYKIAIGENALVMFVSVIFGLLVGMGLSYQMNGFFSTLGDIFDRGGIDRVVFLPWPLILMISAAIFIGMLLAVAISAITAARQDLAVSTRVV